jgi:mannose-1-phosphate guanylyltransferase/phosphomannomutase
MLPAGNRPIIGHVLELLARHGVRRAFINLHHGAAVLQEYCGDGSRWDLEIVYSFEPQLLGTAGTVKHLGPRLGGPAFLVVYGDNYLDCDLSALLAFHERSASLATLALFEKDDVTGSGIVEIDETDGIARFLEKPQPSDVFSHLVNGGLYVLSPAILPLIPDFVPCDFGHHVFPSLLKSEFRLRGRVMHGSLWPSDTPVLYQALCERLAATHASDAPDRTEPHAVRLTESPAQP